MLIQNSRFEHKFRRKELLYTHADCEHLYFYFNITQIKMWRAVHIETDEHLLQSQSYLVHDSHTDYIA